MTTNTNSTTTDAIALARATGELAYLRRTHYTADLPPVWLEVLADADNGVEPLSYAQAVELCAWVRDCPPCTHLTYPAALDN